MGPRRQDFSLPVDAARRALHGPVRVRPQDGQIEAPLEGVGRPGPGRGEPRPPAFRAPGNPFRRRLERLPRRAGESREATVAHQTYRDGPLRSDGLLARWQDALSDL